MQYIHHYISAALQQSTTRPLRYHIPNYRCLRRTEKLIVFSISEVNILCSFGLPLYFEERDLHVLCHNYTAPLPEVTVIFCNTSVTQLGTLPSSLMDSDLGVKRQ